MTKRNFFIFIIVLLVAALFLWGLFAWLKSRSDSQSAGEGTNFFAQFNPFGPKAPTPITPKPVGPSGTGEPGVVSEIKLRRISSVPVAGFGVFQKERFKEVLETEAAPETPAPPETEFAPQIRYVARATGNVYQTFADIIDERKFSGTLVPRVYEAYVGNGGEGVIMRYLKDDERTIATFAGNLPKENLGEDSIGEKELSGLFLPENISDLVLSPDATRIFYLLPFGDGVAGVTAGMLGDKKSQVFDSPYAEWLAQWPRGNMITITTKPSYLAAGYMYTINTDKKDFVKVLGDIYGLTTLTSPDGKLVLYADSTLALSVYDMASKDIQPLSVNTLPEKCIWSKTSDSIYCAVPKFISGTGYPDSWYKGQVSFSDEIWKLDAVTGTAERISDMVSSAGSEDIDGWKLALGATEEYLFFVNKKDSILWELILD